MTCPYGKEDFKRRMEWYSKIVEEYGIPNDVYHYMTFDDATNEAQEFLWCDKVGGKVFWAGRCSDAIEKEVITCTYSKKKRRSKTRL